MFGVETVDVVIVGDSLNGVALSKDTRSFTTSSEALPNRTSLVGEDADGMDCDVWKRRISTGIRRRPQFPGAGSKRPAWEAAHALHLSSTIP